RAVHTPAPAARVTNRPARRKPPTDTPPRPPRSAPPAPPRWYLGRGPEHHDRHVVVGPLAPVVEDRPLDPPGDPGGGPAGARAEQRRQALAAELLAVVVPGLEDAIGDEHQSVAGAEQDRLVGQVHRGEHAEERPVGPVEDLDRF